MKDYNHKQLSEIIHSRLRLAIMVMLKDVGAAEFSLLLEKVNTTDGNLSIHLKKLLDAGYLSSEKKKLGDKNITEYKLTSRGNRAYEMYLGQLEKLVSNNEE